jgi:hypothetical protein
MNKQRIISSNRKRLVCAAAAAAVVLFLAGGANALANTVWTVTRSSSVSVCALPASTTCNTIGAAVSAASLFDIIMVKPGYYNETVYVGTSNLTIMGAQAGKDAREGRNDPSQESIVDASGTPSGMGAGAAFYINGAADVVIDGFTIQGGGLATPLADQHGAAGIFVAGTNTAHIRNNIFRNNAAGVDLSSPGSGYKAGGLIEHNLFKSNNAGKVGSADAVFKGLAGFGIVGSGALVMGAAITENAFEENLAAAVALFNASSVEVTKNTSREDGSFAVFYSSAFCFFSQNQGRDFGAKGFLNLPNTTPPGHADAAVDVDSDTAIEINGNDLEEGKTSGYNGIAFTTLLGTVASSQCRVTNNTIKRFGGNGIVAGEGPVGEPLNGGTLEASSISGNYVADNGNDGILLTEGAPNFANWLVDNKAEGNHTNDCEDDTYLFGHGAGTALTYNTWFNNSGGLSLPAGLCSPGTWH